MPTACLLPLHAPRKTLQMPGRDVLAGSESTRSGANSLILFPLMLDEPPLNKVALVRV